MDNRLPKTDRLLKPSDFAQVFANTRLKVHTDHLIALIHLSGHMSDKKHALGEDQPSNRVRLGLAVSKKRLKKAVDRNRLKRLIREQHRLKKNQLAQILCQHDLGGLDLVLVCKRTPSDLKGALSAETVELYDKLARKLVQINQANKPARASDRSGTKTN